MKIEINVDPLESGEPLEDGHAWIAVPKKNKWGDTQLPLYEEKMNQAKMIRAEIVQTLDRFNALLVALTELGIICNITGHNVVEVNGKYVLQLEADTFARLIDEED